jgi:hypothetical protein
LTEVFDPVEGVEVLETGVIEAGLAATEGMGGALSKVLVGGRRLLRKTSVCER